MKFVDRLKQSFTGTSTAAITLGAAVSGFRTVAQALADDDVEIGEEVPMGVREGATWELSLFRVDSATALSRVRVLASWNGGAPALFPAGAHEIACSPPAEFLNGQDIAAVAALTTVPDTFRFIGITDADELRTITAAVVKAYAGGTTSPADTTKPSAPTNINSTNVTQTGYTISFTPGTDNVAMARTEYNLGSAWVPVSGGATGNTFNVTGRTAGSVDTVQMRSVDTSGNYSTVVTLSVTLQPAVGNQAPALSGSISKTNITTSGFTFSWTAATDVDGNGDRVETSIDGGTSWMQHAFSATTRTVATGAGEYGLRIRAIDSAGLISNVLVDTVTVPAASSGPSASVADATPEDIVLTFSGAIDTAALPAASTFSVTPVATSGTTQAGGVVTLHEVLSVAAVAGQSNQLKLSVRWPFWKGEQARSLVYAPNGTNDLKFSSGTSVGAFTSSISVEAIVTRSYTVEGPPKSQATFPSTTESAPKAMTSGGTGGDNYATAGVGFYLRRTDTGAAARGVRFAWGTSPTVPPCTYNDLALPAGATGNTSVRADAVAQAGRSGGWTNVSAQTASYYGLFAASSSLFARGAAGARYLWMFTHDGFQYAHQTPWYLSAP